MSREYTARKGAEGNAGGHSSERDKKTRNNSDDVNEDERDRRKMAEIVRRMEDRKATKDSDIARRAVMDMGKPAPGVDSKTTKELRGNSDVARITIKKKAEPQDTPKKLVNIRGDTTDANTAHLHAGMQWASGETSDTNIVTQRNIGKGSGRQRGAKKATDKLTATAIEDTQSLEVQNFIVRQYPPIEEGVSSTVRIGRAFVSGALRRRTDDPKIFRAAVNIMECSVRLQKNE